MILSFVASTLILIYLLTTFTRNYFNLPRSFRGPFLASISNLWVVWRCIRADFHSVQTALLLDKQDGKHPSVVRIGPNRLVTNDPELLRHMSLPKSRWTRGEFYEANSLGGESPHIFAERDEARHRALRAKVGNGYSGKGVSNLESSINTQLAAFTNLLRTQYVRKSLPVDLSRVTSYFTLDVLSSIAVGAPFGFLSSNSDKWDYMAGQDAFIPIIQIVCVNSTFRQFFQSKFIQNLGAPKPTDEKGFGRVIRFSAERIEARFQEEKREEKTDMLGSFIKNGLTLEECKSESLIQVIAGSDSTSTVIRMTMLYIATNPRVYRTLQKEVDEAARSLEPDEIIFDAAARQLPYLQAVIWEGIRKNPPLFGVLTKVAPPEGETFGDIFFPGGVEVAICMQAVTHREDVFGEDVWVFRPERWLEGSEQREKMERVTELVFGSGRFGCLGRNIAWMELGKVFVELMRRFEWQVKDPIQPITENAAHSLWIQKGMDMILTERE